MLEVKVENCAGIERDHQTHDDGSAHLDVGRRGHRVERRLASGSRVVRADLRNRGNRSDRLRGNHSPVAGCRANGVLGSRLAGEPDVTCGNVTRNLNAA